MLIDFKSNNNINKYIMFSLSIYNNEIIENNGFLFMIISYIKYKVPKCNILCDKIAKICQLQTQITCSCYISLRDVLH